MRKVISDKIPREYQLSAFNFVNSAGDAYIGTSSSCRVDYFFLCSAYFIVYSKKLQQNLRKKNWSKCKET